MGLSKGSRLVVLVLILAVAAPFPGIAGKGSDDWPVKKNTCNWSAKLVPVGDEPSASGRAVISEYNVMGWPWVSGYASVSCQGLTPGATYRVYVCGEPIAEGTATQRGRFEAGGAFSADARPYPELWSPTVSVSRIDPKLGNVCVLWGSF